MNSEKLPPARPVRRDGWTPERKRRFLESLAAGWDVSRACAFAGMSREGAYKLRRRDPAFARAWAEAQRTALHAADEAFLALLPERLRRTLSELYGECELRGDQRTVRDTVSVVADV